MAQQVKNPPAMQETQEMQVWSLSQEDSLEEEMANCSSILAWKIPWTGVWQATVRVGHDWATKCIHNEINNVVGFVK